MLVTISGLAVCALAVLRGLCHVGTVSVSVLSLLCDRSPSQIQAHEEGVPESTLGSAVLLSVALSAAPAALRLL